MGVNGTEYAMTMRWNMRWEIRSIKPPVGSCMAGRDSSCEPGAVKHAYRCWCANDTVGIHDRAHPRPDNRLSLHSVHDRKSRFHRVIKLVVFHVRDGNAHRVRRASTGSREAVLYAMGSLASRLRAQNRPNFGFAVAHY